MKRYKNIEKLVDSSGKRYIKNAIYPTIPADPNDTYVITTGGDRYDILAQQFYGDSSLWWVISSANVSKNDGLVVKQGVQLRIPYDINKVIEEFERINKER
jgi:hypothetical protein